MMHTLVSIALFAAIAIQGVFAEFTVNTPTVTQCKDVKVAWDATDGPYNLLVVDAADPCGEPLADLGDHDGNHITWSPKLPAGTKIMFSVLDANDEEGWSGSITIADSDDDDCLPASLKKPTSSSAAKSSGGTTLVVTPTSSARTASSSVADPVGAAGADPFSGSNGASAISINKPIMVLSAVAAIFALAL